MRLGLLVILLATGCLASHSYPPQRTAPSVPDKVEVVSSSLRVLPRKRDRFRRSAPQWRKPRDYEFVTRSLARSPRRLSYPEDRPEQADFERRRDFPNRRIIYYATLPEVVRRPGEWTPPRPIYAGYPPMRDNEVTRVHSGLIDVSGKYSHQLPRFTIIDAEPPYARPPQRHYHPYDYRRYDYNRYDYRNHVDPYRYYEHPYRQENLPPQPLTVVRQPIDVRPSLDVRPVHPLSTQAPPSSTTTTQHPSSSSESPEMSTFERTFKQ